MKRFDEDIIGKARIELAALPELPQLRSLCETVRQLSPEISALRARGYTWKALASHLQQCGIPIGATSLRTHYAHDIAHRREARTPNSEPRAHPPKPSPASSRRLAPTTPPAQATPQSAPAIVRSARTPNDDGGKKEVTPVIHPDVAATNSSPSNSTKDAAATIEVLDRPAAYFTVREDREDL